MITLEELLNNSGKYENIALWCVYGSNAFPTMICFKLAGKFQGKPKNYKVIGTSKIFHLLTHYPSKTGTLIVDGSAFIPCKTCKP